MSFQKNGFKVIKNFISEDFADFLFKVSLQKRACTKHMIETRYLSNHDMSMGTWADKQIPETYSLYGDPIFDVLMRETKPIMEKATELKLVENYTYMRVYKMYDELKRHKDRMSCEISATLFLGGQDWDIYLDPTGGLGNKGKKIQLKVGDALVYKGCELEHWREPFDKFDCAQVFLHYRVEDDQSLAEKYDKRPLLGLPSDFKGNDNGF